MHNHRLAWHGHVRVTILHRDGRHEVEEFDNLITDVGLYALLDRLDDPTGHVALTRLALGSGVVEPAVGDTALGSEQWRGEVTAQSRVGATLSTTTYIPPAEATGFTINEIGWFGGPTATATPGSGILFARVLWTRTKTNIESLQIERTDTLARA